MKWESLGFKENPFSTEPIHQKNLDLYVGHAEELALCSDALQEKNVLIVIEGARGVGTTSFANYLRFTSQSNKEYFTPQEEIRVDAAWSLETLLAVIIANIVREIELFHPEKITQDPRFKKAKALSSRISEANRSFGISAFGVGGSYGKSQGTTQPTLVPSGVLGHHLQDLASLVLTLGYRYGILIQLNNLDVGTIHDEDHLRYLFNALRDYIQTDCVSWLLVGDVGLRRFIAQAVDRLDDIVSHEAEIAPLTKKEFGALINKRVEHFRENENIPTPIDMAVFNYLYDITEGRLRYIFGLLRRLISRLHLGDLTDRLTLDIAKPMVKKLAQARLSKYQLTAAEEQVLITLVNEKNATVTQLAQAMNKTANYISKVLVKLSQDKLVTSQKAGKNKHYQPELDAMIAYSEY
ncbi:MAG: hypothetical protein KIT27_07945 [Legionellales bacterium]|nr:hypothetical protein [Legionellales bacterium]